LSGILLDGGCRRQPGFEPWKVFGQGLLFTLGLDRDPSTHNRKLTLLAALRLMIEQLFFGSGYRCRDALIVAAASLGEA